MFNNFLKIKNSFKKKKSKSNKKPIIDDKLLCSECKCAMTGPIYQSVEKSNDSYNICGHCEWKIRSKTDRLRNRMVLRNLKLENKINQQCIVCPHSEEGCKRKFFKSQPCLLHKHVEEECVYESFTCPICETKIAGSRLFKDHISSGDCKETFKEISTKKSKRCFQTVLNSRQSSVVVNEEFDYLLCFLWKDNLYFEVFCISLCNFSTTKKCNQQFKIEFMKIEEAIEYKRHDFKSYNQTIGVPEKVNLTITMEPLTRNVVPYSQLSKAVLFVGPHKDDFIQSYFVQYFSSAEFIQIGTQIQCQDSFGKWMNGEVIAIGEDVNGKTSRKRLTSSNTQICVKACHNGYLGQDDSCMWLDLNQDIYDTSFSNHYCRLEPYPQTLLRLQRKSLNNT